MSYNTVHAAFIDTALRQRISAALQQEARTLTNEGTPLSNAIKASNQTVLDEFAWYVASGNDAAYASAVANHNPNPGGDEAVITDQAILSSVQGAWSHVTAPTG